LTANHLESIFYGYQKNIKEITYSPNQGFGRMMGVSGESPPKHTRKVSSCGMGGGEEVIDRAQVLL
jgi:hypothetical protein